MSQEAEDSSPPVPEGDGLPWYEERARFHAAMIEHLNSAPTPEERQRRKIRLHGMLYYLELGASGYPASKTALIDQIDKLKKGTEL